METPDPRIATKLWGFSDIAAFNELNSSTYRHLQNLSKQKRREQSEMEERCKQIWQIRLICKQLGELEKICEEIESAPENDISNKELLLREYENGMLRKINELIIYYNKL